MKNVLIPVQWYSKPWFRVIKTETLTSNPQQHFRCMLLRFIVRFEQRWWLTYGSLVRFIIEWEERRKKLRESSAPSVICISRSGSAPNPPSASNQRDSGREKLTKLHNNRRHMRGNVKPWHDKEKIVGLLWGKQADSAINRHINGKPGGRRFFHS